ILTMIRQRCNGYPFNLPALQAIGYKELLSYLKGEIVLERAIALIKKRSRNYAKRQYTWFKREEGIIWLDITGIFNPEKILDRILSALKGFR
ncbi:MAG: hypothetical protein N2511_05925, partial [Thermodesulfovibrionales bacterium]|nr:hypothetical protein [Thermodesulfovibrionales bacterium]